MNNSLITVIIPMFNEEKNILQCLETLQKQSVQSFSVIFIDDGSVDNTLVQLENNLQKMQPKFNYSILQQNNQGAAKAREVAIRASQTEYALILDCDDQISTNTIQNTIDSILNTKADISLPNLHIQQKNGVYHPIDFPNNQESFTGLEALKYTLGKWLLPGVMCAKKSIFIKSYDLYNKLNPHGLNYMNNDEVISRFNFYHAHNVVRNYSTYFYVNNQNSTTKKVNPNRYLMAKNVQILYSIFGKEFDDISINVQVEYINVLWGLIQYTRKNRKELPNYSEWVKQIHELISVIKPDLKTFQLPSFKSKSRLWLSILIAKTL